MRPPEGMTAPTITLSRVVLAAAARAEDGDEFASAIEQIHGEQRLHLATPGAVGVCEWPQGLSAPLPVCPMRLLIGISVPTR